MAFVVSVPIPIRMPRFQGRGLQMAGKYSCLLQSIDLSFHVVYFLLEDDMKFSFPVTPIF